MTALSLTDDVRTLLWIIVIAAALLYFVDWSALFWDTITPWMITP